MANGVFIGRREAIGVGKETTAGTAVAPAFWQRHLKLALDQKTNTVDNLSAMGRIENINDSLVAEQWSEGSINGKVTDVSIGLFLLNIFGSQAAALHPAETIVYDNTFTVGQTNVPPTLTFSRWNPIINRRYAYGTLTDFELDITMGGWAQFTSTFMAKAGATATDTVAFIVENEFTSKHVVVKNAANIAGLTGATALPLKSLKMKISRKASRFTPFGVIDPTAFDTESWGVTGDLVLRYIDTTLEATALANTRQAMSIALINTDTTIGATTNPSVTFTAPKVRFQPIVLDDPLDQVLSETVSFQCEFDVALSYMMQAVLTNTQNGY